MNELNNNSMTVTYPSIYVGTNETQIFFTNSTPNLTEIYKPGKNDFQTFELHILNNIMIYFKSIRFNK